MWMCIFCYCSTATERVCEWERKWKRLSEREKEAHFPCDLGKKFTHIRKTCAILKQWALDKCTYLLAWKKSCCRPWKQLEPTEPYRFPNKRKPYVWSDYSLINCNFLMAKHTDEEWNWWKSERMSHRTRNTRAQKRERESVRYAISHQGIFISILTLRCH